MKDEINSYMRFNLHQLKGFYIRNWKYILIFYFPNLIFTLCAVEYGSIRNYFWYGLGFISVVLSFMGAYLLIRPILLNILIPIILKFFEFISLVIKICQIIFVHIAKLIEIDISK